MDATFQNDGFTYSGMYLTYRGQFIARFKYRGAPIGKASFLKQLKKRFTPATYFATRAAGIAPLEILAQDDPEWHKAEINKWLVKNGAPPRP